MKKLLSILFIVSFLITSSVFADNNINNYEEALKAEQRAKEDKESLDLNIFIDGRELVFRKEENLGMPFIDEKNRMLVPLRKPIEMSGNEVTWDKKTKTANIKVNKTTGNKKTLSIKIADNFLTETVNGKSKKIEMDTKAIIKEGRTYIPLRAVLEGIGLRVSYNKKTKTISAFEDGKVWQGLDEINKEFPGLIEGVKEYDPIPESLTLDTLKLDNSYQDKMKLEIGDVGYIVKDIKLKTPTRDGMLFIKDKKVVFRADGFLDDYYYFYKGDERRINNPYATYQGDIEDVDYFMIYTRAPIATLIENPFKNKDVKNEDIQREDVENDNNDNEQIH